MHIIDLDSYSHVHIVISNNCAPLGLKLPGYERFHILYSFAIFPCSAGMFLKRYWQYTECNIACGQL